jgi:hypothetical protein
MKFATTATDCLSVQVLMPKFLKGIFDMTSNNPALSQAGEPCAIPPVGWYCTRRAGHTGPCAAIMIPPDNGQNERPWILGFNAGWDAAMESFDD